MNTPTQREGAMRFVRLAPMIVVHLLVFAVAVVVFLLGLGEITYLNNQSAIQHRERCCAARQRYLV